MEDKAPIGAKKLLKGMVNPLLFPQAEAATSELHARLFGQITAESLLAFLCVPGFDCSLEQFAQRYREISEGEPGLPVVPAEERILNKLIWPLRHAKGSYILGNYLGAIALCGMVAEMVAIVMFEISELHVQGEPINEKMQIALFGRSFERLGQDQRVKILEATLLRDPALKKHFDTIRECRKKYLHFWTRDHESIPADAASAYKSAATLVSGLLELRFEGWGVKMHPSIEKYLQQKDQFIDIPEPPASSNTDEMPPETA